MAKPLPELVRRMRDTEMTVGHFSGKRWRPGRVDCAQLAAYHLKRFGWTLPKVGRYRTIAEGQARLADLGAATMAELIDAIGLPRRPSPAFALIGDLVFGPGDDALGAIGIALGNGAIKGFHEDHAGLVSMRSDAITVAWNVMP